MNSPGEYVEVVLGMVVLLGFPLALATVALLAYLRLRLRSFLWLALAQVVGTALALFTPWLKGQWVHAHLQAQRASGDSAQFMAALHSWSRAVNAVEGAVGFALMLTFVLLLTRELGALQAAAGRGGETGETPV